MTPEARHRELCLIVCAEFIFERTVSPETWAELEQAAKELNELPGISSAKASLGDGAGASAGAPALHKLAPRKQPDVQ